MKNAYAKEQAELRRQLLNYGALVVHRTKSKSAAALDDLKQWTNDNPTRRKA